MNTTCQRLFISKKDLHQTAVQADPDAPAARALVDGEARLSIEHFALTANNITYAACGELMKYWYFFPAPDAAWGCLPVWGFATVSESRAEGLPVGTRVYGYLPAGTHLVVQASRVSERGFVDASAHRQPLPALYNQYTLCAADPGWRADSEGLQAVLRPLFMTAFLIDDFLADNQFFGAQQLLLSSASSKTAYATAFFLSQRRGTPGQPQVLGLTSPANLAFTTELGCYDQTVLYANLGQLKADTPSVYVDFSGSVDLRKQLHQHFDAALKYSCSIGATHWQNMGPAGHLPGPKPTLFFAPAQMAKRSEPPPQGLGRSVMMQRMGAGWLAFLAAVQRADKPWVHIVNHQGASAVQAAYAAQLSGKADASQGFMLSLQS
jgi:Protein of unknown function (DUF2855)